MALLILRRFRPEPPLVLRRFGPDGRLSALAERGGAAAVPVAVAAPQPFEGFGYLDMSDLDDGIALDLPAGQWVRVTRNLVPSPVRSRLRGAAAGHDYWDGNLIWPIADGETFGLQIAYRVISDVTDGFLIFEVRPGGNRALNQGPSPIRLLAPAGEPEGYYTPLHDCNVSATFAVQGAEVWAMHTRGGSLLAFSPEFTPRSFAGAQS